MTTYCLGFLFTKDLRYVAVINKQKPAWQKDLWNGIGGKVEPDESGIDAVAREFLEETGHATDAGDWQSFGRLLGKDFEVYLYTGVTATVTPPELKKLTDEMPDWLDIRGLTQVPTIPNLQWLVPMAVDFLRNPESFSETVTYYERH